MSTFLQHGFIANAAALGLNWIYNMPYLERLAKEQDILFLPVDEAKYKRAGKAFLAYPNAPVGTISVQGEIARWLKTGLEANPAMTKEQYQELVFEQIKPGGSYVGYVESYGKQLVINKLAEQVKGNLPALNINDDQMVGLIPYWVCKDRGESSERAFELAQAFTSIEDFYDVYKMFDALIEAIPKVGMRQAIKQASKLAPASMKIPVQKAMDLENTMEFITNHSGTACHIPHAVPLILHILYHTDSFEAALQKNTVIGGASCDRGMTIGALAGLAYPVPEEWLTYGQ